MNKILLLKYNHNEEAIKQGGIAEYLTNKIQLGECPEMTEDIAREIISEYDLDNDGKLCFEEFAKLLMDDKGDDMINENLQQ